MTFGIGHQSYSLYNGKAENWFLRVEMCLDTHENLKNSFSSLHRFPFLKVCTLKAKGN